jgi:hypothetical protein
MTPLSDPPTQTAELVTEALRILAWREPASAAVGAGSGDDDQLPFCLWQSVLGIHQRIVVVQECPQFRGTTSQTAEDVGHEPGLRRSHRRVSADQAASSRAPSRHYASAGSRPKSPSSRRTGCTATQPRGGELVCSTPSIWPQPGQLSWSAGAVLTARPAALAARSHRSVLARR